MQYIVLAILFYLQNFIVSLFLSFIFIPNIFEFLTLLLLVLLLSKLKYYKQLLYTWQLLYFIQFSFIAYFTTTITYIDIYLFFTHIEETFETFISLYNILLVPIIILLVFTIIIYTLKLPKSNISSILLILLLIFSITFTSKPSDASFQLLNELYNTHKLYNSAKPIIKKEEDIKPIRKQDINIILVIGESMRAKEFTDTKYSIFENYNYRTIYSGATNTDVSIPLLLNGAIRPSKINLENNIFRLAKKNSFHTSFISTQSKKSFKYIKPYIYRDSIDNYKVLNKYDIKLLDHLNQIDLNKNNLIVLQMNGQHSPYLNYPNSNRFDDIKTRYKKSMNYSNQVLEKLIDNIKSNSKKPYIFIFTSDHSEQIGENGKYGHNRFDKIIYNVPYIYTTNLDNKLDTIKSHNDIYQHLLFYLGYKKQITYIRPIKIYGTMITEEDGFINIK